MQIPRNIYYLLFMLYFPSMKRGYFSPSSLMGDSSNSFWPCEELIDIADEGILCKGGMALNIPAWKQKIIPNFTGLGSLEKSASKKSFWRFYSTDDFVAKCMEFPVRKFHTNEKTLAYLSKKKKEKETKLWAFILKKCELIFKAMLKNIERLNERGLLVD